MSDPLQSVVKALRETTSGEESGAARYTRSRILAAARLQKRRKVFRITFGLPLAAILVGSGAWAASGQSLPVFVQRVSVALGLREQPPILPSKPAHSTHTGQRPGRPIAPAAFSAAETDVNSTAVEPEQKPAIVPTSESPSAEAQDERSSPKPSASAKSVPRLPRDSRVTEQELLLYEKAHRAHFVDRDSGVALIAWTEYLQKAPRGRFAVEANYNRALCLLRLGRNGEAREALVPFAGGAYGGYRKAEAEALVERIAQEPVKTP